MSKIIDFYTLDGTDQSDRTHADILKFNDEQLEEVHDFIKWIFPVRKRSQCSDTSPVLTDDDVLILKNSPVALLRLHAAIGRMILFYKLGTENEGWWATPHNHNLLRITRIIQCLSIFGLFNEAETLHRKFVSVAVRNNVPERTLQFWREALLDG